MTPERVSARRRELAIWLREGLVRLGPTFIKIGQQFSTRVDVLSKEFIEELEKLQDDVPPFDWESARAIVETSMGARIEDKFQKFEERPIAAASLGQVHLATLADGRPVVVKVQRPGLKDLFDIDLKNIRVIAQFFQKAGGRPSGVYRVDGMVAAADRPRAAEVRADNGALPSLSLQVDPKTDGAARDWVAIYDECARILYQEIDYTQEGRNATRFAQNFKDVPWVKVPQVYWDMTTNQVLTMEYTPGIKINRAEELTKLGLDKTRLARLTVESYLMQILRHGL